MTEQGTKGDPHSDGHGEDVDEEEVGYWLKLKRAKAEADRRFAEEQMAGEPNSSLLDRLSRDGTWLDEQQFAPLEYAVPGIVPEGMGLLVGPPKTGKSWLVGNIGLAVARGGLALQAIRVTQRPVLYLALEDGDRRLQSRFRRLLGPCVPIPAGISRITKATPAEAMAVITEFMARHLDEKPLVILDTLGKVKRHKHPGEESYLVDYEVGSRLKALADAVPGSTLLVVHHTRKAESADFVDSVSGTQGIAGSVDFVLVLARKRHENNAILSVTGRDIIEAEYALTADDGVVWRLDGDDLSAARENVQQRRAEASMGDRQMDVYLAVAATDGPVTAIDVASQLEGMDNNSAGQYLRRLHASGHIHKISRGVFSLHLPAETTDEVEAPHSFTSDTSFTPFQSTSAQNRVNEVNEMKEQEEAPPAPDSTENGAKPAETIAEGFARLKVELASGVASAPPTQEDDLHHRIKGVITRRLLKVGHAGRAELRRALDSTQRPEFQQVFDALVAQEYLVTVEGTEGRWRLANP